MTAVTRRQLLKVSPAVVAAMGSNPAVRAATPGDARTRLSVGANGTYETVPLEKESISLGVMQTRVRPIDLNNVKQSRKANLDHMTAVIDAAHGSLSSPLDLMLFHEFPITGFGTEWTRKDVHDKVAIEVPGDETEALSRKARLYDTYIVFGSYIRDKDWPGHVLSVTTIIDNRDAIIGKHWKARNIMGVMGSVELFTTTIYGVLDRYIEMYGADAVISVTRTPRGNLSATSVQREPELIRSLALKGTEICLRTATGGFSPWDVQSGAASNQIWTAICNNAYSPGALDLGIFEDAQAGGCAIYDPRGELIARAGSAFEQAVVASIPLGAYRRQHRQPAIAWDLYKPVYEAYLPQYPAGHYTGHQPETLTEAKKYMDTVKRY